MPNRRITLDMSVGVGCDISRCKDLLLELMSEDDRVLADPRPAVFIMDANAVGVNISGYCWVDNSDWLAARSDLWIQVVEKFDSDPSVTLSLDKQEVLLSGELNQ